MDIDEILKLDLTQYSYNEKKEEQTQVVNLYAKEKSMYLSYASYAVLGLSIVGFVLVMIFGLPVHNAVWWGIPYYLYTLGHIAPFILVGKNRKHLKLSNKSKEYNNIALSFSILSFMLSLSMMMLFVGRAISPNFMLGF